MVQYVTRCNRLNIDDVALHGTRASVNAKTAETPPQLRWRVLVRHTKLGLRWHAIASPASTVCHQRIRESTEYHAISCFQDSAEQSLDLSKPNSPSSSSSNFFLRSATGSAGPSSTDKATPLMCQGLFALTVAPGSQIINTARHENSFLTQQRAYSDCRRQGSYQEALVETPSLFELILYVEVPQTAESLTRRKVHSLQNMVSDPELRDPFSGLTIVAACPCAKSQRFPTDSTSTKDAPHPNRQLVLWHDKVPGVPNKLSEAVSHL